MGTRWCCCDGSDLGAHIDGLIGVVGHTVVCTANPTVPITGRKSDAICAAYYAAEAALRLLRPGNKVSTPLPLPSLTRSRSITHPLFAIR